MDAYIWRAELGIPNPGETNRERIGAVYARQLARCRATMPEYYQWPESELATITARMLAALDRGSFSKDSPAWRATCKELGIKHTYTAIREYVRG